MTPDLPRSLALNPESSTQKPRQRADVTIQSAGRETIVYDPLTDTIHVLNPTALAIWELCDGQHTPSEMITVLQSRFSGTAGYDVNTDIGKTLDVLLQEKLISLDE